MSVRVGLIVYGVDRSPTGIGRYTLELGRALASLHPRPDVVLLVAGGAEPLAALAPFPRYALAGCRLLPALLTAGNAVIARAARQLQLDVVHDPTGVAPFLLSKHRFRTVLTLHDVFPLSFPGYSTLLDTLIYRYWLPRMTARLDAIITVSRHSRQDIERYLNVPAAKITPIYPGVSAAFAPITSNEIGRFLQERFGLTAPYLLYAGALTPRKNIGRILEAFAQLHLQFPELQLVLAGPLSGKQTPLPERVTEQVPAGHVIFTGAVSDDELAMLYRGARLFLFPSLYEGFGLPVLEAMACGTPVLTSNRSSLPEVAGEAALLVDPLDVAGMVDNVRRVLVEPELAARLSKQGRARASMFSWQRTAEETLALYETVGVSRRVLG